MALLKVTFAIVIALATACSAPVDAVDTDLGEVPDVVDSRDVANLDIASPDADDGPDLDAGPNVPSSWLRFETTSAEVVEGELVAVYDTARWWNPLGGLVYAVFDSSRYAPYPGDRSFRFLLATDVTAIEPALRPTPGPSYRDFLRQSGIVFRRPPLAETSYVITGNGSYHLEEDGYGDFAWDVERTDDAGRRLSGTGAANEDYLVWDQPVLSGVRGEVIEVIDTGVDNPPGSHPTADTAVNNLVGIALGGSFYAYYLHFREGGIEPGVVVGAPVAVGDTLGRAGNSGVTLEPHIHVVLLWYDVEAGRSYSVPAEFLEVSVSPTPLGPFTATEYYVPRTGDWLRAM